MCRQVNGACWHCVNYEAVKRMHMHQHDPVPGSPRGHTGRFMTAASASARASRGATPRRTRLPYVSSRCAGTAE